ncbi:MULTISPECIES: oligopeptide/dipeptide ABC transporter ATP-binding protein [unclassified Chelatococcus]|uniref:ABC transporter ATP-binding protein n=1 Tax=unclassified Chelatococcus TaxID=2638111 RepID=UPI001BCF0212|nr:oligopeptide/dipeptide ABC transporter ATP-binding protein [Chelatococcus sp.]MBS7742114.1 ATP-binding cassette domain-containing protein [Chelatococcus sp. HY11]CAH1647975.1 putative peptide ABC transporter ATP-binding protein y4tS [Hyphomicrobiales bacterium]MBX3542768.1 ATP-binding cassette domain-containing protein [Chelatococcus sp.]MCO5075017.1 ATP-binding cassette domain-containing protein [Chelatococcus sp.]CAH1690121.1 putative peptide ABC transporter ATP-binding protein y4tS [Hyph
MSALLNVRDLARQYQVTGDRGEKRWLHAVDGVNFTLDAGRTLGVVGESGCGKSTTAKLVLGLLPATRGRITFAGETVSATRDAQWRALRRRMQMVHQDPLAALDRRLTVGEQVVEPLVIHDLVGGTQARREKALALFDAVGLRAAMFERYPHELSGGQRQRVVLARALVLNPQLVVCDEPISALDVSVAAQVINLLQDLQQHFGMGYLFISHDLKVVRQIADEVAVMYLGRIVEQGAPDDLFHTPAHPYTEALVSAVPTVGRRDRQRIVLKGDPPNPVDRPAGCAFHPRCPRATAVCRSETPPLRRVADGRLAACHLVPAVSSQSVAA